MPNMFGGDQCDPAYNPLYGRTLEEKQREENRTKEGVNRSLELAGVRGLDLFADYSIGIQQGDEFEIRLRGGNTLGAISTAGYIKITYRDSGLVDTRQVDAAMKLADRLREHGCNQIIENPARHTLIANMRALSSDVSGILKYLEKREKGRNQ